MFDSPAIVVGLEVGTSKVCAVVGQLSENGAPSIIGLGQARSRGVRKGEIVNASLASEDIRNAIVEAEQMADVEIRSVFLGVSGGHLRGFNNRGFHAVLSADREISEDDVQDVMKNARAINLPAENRVVHVIRQHFSVDGQSGIPDPSGMFGARLEVDVHVIHGHCSRLQNPIRAVKTLEIEVENIVFNGVASSLSILAPEQKELGAVVIDLGAGSTEYVVYSEGIIKHAGVLAVGGDHVTNDLAWGLKVSMSRAEKLKIEHGCAVLEDEVRGRLIHLTNDHGLPERTLSVEHLHRIMAARISEIFELIADELEAAGLLDYLRCGVFLAGGGARIPQIEKAAERVFGLPVSPGRASAMGGLKSALDQPEFATAIGLMRFGSFEHQRQAARPPVLSGLGHRMRQWFRQVQPFHRAPA